MERGLGLILAVFDLIRGLVFPFCRSDGSIRWFPVWVADLKGRLVRHVDNVDVGASEVDIQGRTMPVFWEGDQQAIGDRQRTLMFFGGLKLKKAHGVGTCLKAGELQTEGGVWNGSTGFGVDEVAPEEGCG